MAKRLSPNQSEGSDDPDDSQTGYEEVAAKKRRLVQFESMRLLSIHSTNEIDDKAARVQVYKLSETVRYKNKVLDQKEREIERLRQRQTTDENTSCTINRHWNNLDEQMRFIVMRGSNAHDVNELLKSSSVHGESSAQFLEDVVQMNEQERQAVYDKRVQTSIQLLNQIMSIACKNAEQYKSLSKRMLSHIDDSNTDSRDDRLNELVHLNSTLSDENSRLTKDCYRMQKMLSTAQLKAREAEDTIEQLKTRNEELIQEKADKEFELDKARRQVNKLDYRLYTTVKDQQKLIAAAAHESKPQNGVVTNGLSTGEPNSQEADALRVELEQQRELAAARLGEIKDLNERILKYVQDLELAKIEAKQLSVEKCRSSKEYEDLMKFFSLAVDEVTRYRKDYETAVEERELIRQEMFVVVEDMKKEEQLALRKVISSSEKINNDNNQVRKEYDILKMEYEQSLANASGQDNRANDYKLLYGSTKAQNAQLKSESARLSKKLREANNHINKLQKELDTERQRISKCILIEIDESDDPSGDGKDHEDRSPKERIKELEALIDGFKHIEGELREKAEILSRERRFRAENEKLSRHINKLMKMDKKDKLRFFEAEYQKQINAKDLEITALTRERNELLNAEGALNQELESIGQALEELQEQNGSLMKQKQYLEQEKMKMMGDRISSTQVQQKLKEEKVLFETQVHNINRQMMAQNCEHLHVKESLLLAKESIAVKTKENAILNKTLETLRKQVMELSMKTDSSSTTNEKLTEQLKFLQEAVLSKAEQHEINMQKARRLEEEKAVLKKKLKMSQKSEKLGSADAVLLEEIKELKEILTCPSCKVNRKDAILTKCFHVFCLECIKTRYDTRQRKCPKCNVGFGANDFQRAYIG